MIVRMNKISITGLMEERSAIVRRLMKLGVVQLAEIPMTGQEREQALEMARFDDASKRILEIDEELRKIGSAIDYLTENAPGGRTKTNKRELSFDSFVNPKTYSGVWEKVFEVNDLQKRLNDKKSALAALQNEIMFLKLWEGLDVPVDFKETAKTVFLAGTVPSTVDTDALVKRSKEIGPVILNIINSDKDQSYVSVIIHKSVLREAEEELRLSGFSKASFGGMTGTIAENLEARRRQIHQVQTEIDDIINKSIKSHEYLPSICGLYDYIYNMQQRRIVRSNFLVTEKAFFVGGWVPEEHAQRVKGEIEGEFTAFVQITQPDEGEQTPVLLKNNRLVYPFEMITEMFSLPLSNGIDPNAVMAPFYWMFFGIMLSDAGYGIILSVLCGIAVWKLKLEKGTILDKMLKMLFLCGISTAIWGAMFGSWFGDVFGSVFNRPIAPIWFDPNKDPMKLLVWAFIFGGIHLFTGMAVKAYMLIREGKWLDAVFDIGFWYVALIGIALLFAGGQAAATGKNMMIAGTIGLVLTQGRSEKNIIKKITTGILSLYDATGFLSDVLSYSRLLALGLATGVVSQVINQLGILGGGFKSVFTAAALFAILIVGHTFNLSINTLGAYVHSSRLQYVEFFGKFYESGGAAFAPLKPKMKYIKIK